MLRLEKNNYINEKLYPKPYYDLKSTKTSFESQLNSIQTEDKTSNDSNERSELFSVITVFHAISGLSYYGRHNIRFQFLTTTVSLLFVLLTILCHFSRYITDYDFELIKTKSVRLSESRSAEVVSFLLFCNGFIRSIGSDLIVLFVAKDLCLLYKNWDQITRSNKLILNNKREKRLTLIAWIIIIVNILYASLNLFLWYSLVERFAIDRTKAEQSKEQPQNDYAKQLANNVNLYLFLALKLIAAIHSAAFDSIIIYISLIINDLCDELALKAERFRSHTEIAGPFGLSQSRASDQLEEVRLGFASALQLSVHINEILSPALLFTVATNLISLFGGVFIAIDLIGYKDPIEKFEIVLIFNAIVCFTSLSLICFTADCAKNSVKNIIKILNVVRINSLNDFEYKSVSDRAWREACKLNCSR